MLKFFHALTIFYCISSLLAGTIAACISVTCLLAVAKIGLLLDVLMLILALLITVIGQIKGQSRGYYFRYDFHSIG